MYIVTIDGPVASGKSSVSRELAHRLSWSWLSTGVFYRGFAFIAHENHLDIKNQEALVCFFQKVKWLIKLSPERTKFFYKDKEISERSLRRLEIGTLSSMIARLPKVRDFLLEPQRQTLKQASKGLVAEGRDCGTIVFKRQALLKFYLTASIKSRAERRFWEKTQSYQDVIRDQKIRDQNEKTRNIAPLKKASDAIFLDTSSMEFEQVVKHIHLMVLNELK